MSREKILDLLRENYPRLADEYGVKRLGLFGSYARGEASDDSDIDIAVEFERPIGFRIVDFAEDLEKLFGRKVDVLTPAGIRGIRVAGIAEDIIGGLVYV